MMQEFAGGALSVQHQDGICLQLLQADRLALQYKNRKYLKEHPQAQGRSYEEAVQARQAAEPEEETTPAPAGQFEKEGC